MVEDDANIRIVAGMALEGIGNWQVFQADCGEAGIETAITEKPDLILLDVMMPGMDGPTTLLKLQECMNPMPPVVFITAKAQPSDIATYQRLGAAGVIPKPFDPMTLVDEIVAILRSKFAATA